MKAGARRKVDTIAIAMVLRDKEQYRVRVRVQRHDARCDGLVRAFCSSKCTYTRTLELYGARNDRARE